MAKMMDIKDETYNFLLADMLIAGFISAPVDA